MSDNAPANYLPEETQIQILSRTPVKSLMRFRCVCKRWCFIISDPQFVQLHLSCSISLNREHILLAPDEILFPYEINDPLVDDSFDNYDPNLYYVGTCNGLVCFSMDNEELVVFNPSTQCYKELPIPPEIDDYYFSWGFGYDTSTDDYKIVLCLEQSYLSNNSNKFMVISFKDNIWRIIYEFGQVDAVDLKYSASPIFLNGSLHWLGCRHDNLPKFILSFDLSGEVLTEIPEPNESPFSDGQVPRGCRHIGVIEECLWMSREDWNGFDYQHNMWVMKEYNIKASWVKLFTIPTFSPCTNFSPPLFFMKSGEILVTTAHRNLVIYYPSEDRQQTIITTTGISLDDMVVVPYIESLVSPLCGKDWKGNRHFKTFMKEKVTDLNMECISLNRL